jgi:hypothetical protein
MNKLFRIAAAAWVLSLATACGSPEWVLDQRSYRLGSIGAFAEMVDAGVKKLALSAPLEPTEMDALMEEVLRIAEQHNVEIFLEPTFLVTDLFPAELTEGKQVLLIYRGGTLGEYQELKAEKYRLQATGQWEGEARQEIARRFGALLSYSDQKIEALLSGQVTGS